MHLPSPSPWIMLNINRSQNFYTGQTRLLSRRRVVVSCSYVRRNRQSELITRRGNGYVYVTQKQAKRRYEVTCKAILHAGLHETNKQRTVRPVTAISLFRTNFSIEIFLQQYRDISMHNPCKSISKIKSLNIFSNSQSKRVKGSRFSNDTIHRALFILSGYFSTIRNILQRDKPPIK